MAPWYRMPDDDDARREATLERLQASVEVSRCAMTILLATPLDGYQREIVWAVIRRIDDTLRTGRTPR